MKIIHWHRIFTTKKGLVTSSGILFCFVVIIALTTVVFASAPSNFPFSRVVRIPKNTSLSGAADILVKKNIIKSAFLYKVSVVLASIGHKTVQAGDYLFDTPQSVVSVAERTIHGIQGLPKIRVTIQEGLNSKQIANVLARAIPEFDTITFLKLAKPEEGYLFPDTYTFYENTTPEEIIHAMKNSFDNSIQSVRLEISLSSHPLKEIMTMASIVEREATSTQDRRVIAGILWKRIQEKMPLQVDPPFYYLFGKNSSQLTLTELKTYSPYNLYLNKGLPPGPISNPGLDAIKATMNPVDTKYYFYLSDSRGVMRYAETHDDHVANKRRYL